MPAEDATPLNGSHRAIGYGGLVAAVVGLSLAGYIGYIVYPRFDLPAGRGALLLALAAGAGVASFFSPCSFLLLVTMLARPLQDGRDNGKDPRGTGALRFAAALSIGATTFLLLVGTFMALGADAVFEDVTFTSPSGRVIRGLVGTLLIVLGLIQLSVLRVSLRRFESASHAFLGQQADPGNRSSMVRFGLFGFVYLLAGFG